MIEIDGFVPKKEIDELYLNNTYYIVCDGEVGQQAFAVIREAIRQEGMVATGKVVFTSREHVIALDARGNSIMGVTLRYPYEVRKEAEYFDDIPDEKVTKERICSTSPSILWRPRRRISNPNSSRTAMRMRSRIC